MSAVNFSANGTRWRAMLITGTENTGEYVPPPPGTGILFTSADGDVRFLPLEQNALPTADYLRGKSVAELGSLVQLAQVIDR